MPRLPRTVLELLRSDVASAASPRLTLGLTTLRDLALQRDAWRPACLELLLELCTAGSAPLRAPSIRLVVSMAAGEGVAQAAAVDQIAARAHSHAAEELEAALAAEEEEEAARRLPLYLALCNRSPSMLAALLAGFDGASAAAQATVQELLPGLLLHLPMEAVTEVLLAQLRGEPDASPPLAAASPLPLLALHVRAIAEGHSARHVHDTSRPCRGHFHRCSPIAPPPWAAPCPPR
uniref:Uncharacterized protein n=2 Tax=Emiliania huxleyi TaxID=2903 RepID=A0A7S3TSE9_EMIHU